jgi:hypothetical protein
LNENSRWTLIQRSKSSGVINKGGYYQYQVYNGCNWNEKVIKIEQDIPPKYAPIRTSAWYISYCNGRVYSSPDLYDPLHDRFNSEYNYEWQYYDRGRSAWRPISNIPSVYKPRYGGSYRYKLFDDHGNFIYSPHTNIAQYICGRRVGGKVEGDGSEDIKIGLTTSDEVITEEEILELNKALETTISPNPAYNITYIDINVLKIELEGDLKIEFIDLTGRVVKTANLNDVYYGNSNTQVYVGDVAIGTYIFRLTDAKGEFETGKIVIDRK